MTNLQWTENTKPDRPGIWATKTGAGYQPFIFTVNQPAPSEGTYAFLMDLPTIVDPPQYRDVTAADVGREVEVSDSGKRWESRELLMVLPEGLQNRFIVTSRAGNGWIFFQHARILDTQPEVRQALPEITLGGEYKIEGRPYRLFKTAEESNGFTLSFCRLD